MASVRASATMPMRLLRPRERRVGMIRGAASAGSLADEEPAPAGVCLELLTIPGDSRGLDKGSPHRKKHERGLEAT
jgi:hypothetical protein